MSVYSYFYEMEFSIHLMTYNCEKFVSQCLQSIVEQKTNFPFEIVIGDDASTDKTIEIIKSYMNHHDNIYVKIHEKNIGILRNFIDTFNRCSGKYIFDIAGDDWLSNENALQLLYDKLEDNPSFGFVDSGYSCYFQKTKKIIPFKNAKNLEATKAEYIQRHKLNGTLLMGLCYRKSAVDKHVNFEDYLKKKFDYEDYPIITDLVFNSDFGFVNSQLSVYRQHRESHSKHNKSGLKVMLYFAKKYNYSEEEVEKIHQNYNNQMLHNASLRSDKKAGRKHYKPFRQPVLRNFVYFLSSQSNMARKFFNLFRKI